MHLYRLCHQFSVFIYIFDDSSLLVNSLNIETEVCIKVDEKLTIFMINTRLLIKSLLWQIRLNQISKMEVS